MRILAVLALASCSRAPSAADGPTAPSAAEHAAAGAPAPPRAADAVVEGAPVTSLYQLTATTIEGEARALAAYQGKVALVVNTASECGSTPQYEGLEALWKTYRDRGLVVLGFPSNDFGGQEPGTEAEIHSFCKRRYGVSFPLFAKSVVKGDQASPVFRFLGEARGAPQWNFHKYLVGRDGTVIEAFATKVAPDDKALIAAIEAALAVP